MIRSCAKNIALAFAFVAIVSASGCAKKTKPEENLTSTPTTVGADENASGDSDSGKAMGLQTVHFAYDSSAIDAGAKDVLKANADILKQHSNVKVQIEGHCDSRGGIQYNLALGEKRAAAVKSFLVESGVHADRISTVSFGKEKLLDRSGTDAGEAKNRRANFVVTSR